MQMTDDAIRRERERIEMAMLMASLGVVFPEQMPPNNKKLDDP